MQALQPNCASPFLSLSHSLTLFLLGRVTKIRPIRPPITLQGNFLPGSEQHHRMCNEPRAICGMSVPDGMADLGAHVIHGTSDILRH